MVKTNKKVIDEFKDLDVKTKNRYASQIKRLEKHGLTLTQAKKLSNQELAEKLEYKGLEKNLDKTMDAYKKNYNAITIIPSRRQDTIKYEIIEKEGILKGSSEYTIRNKELIKTVGSRFWAVIERLNEIQKTNPNLVFKDYYYTREVKDSKGNLVEKTYKTNEIFDYARDFLSKAPSIVDMINSYDVNNPNELDFIIPSIYNEKVELEQWEFDLALEFDTP